MKKIGIAVFAIMLFSWAGMAAEGENITFLSEPKGWFSPFRSKDLAWIAVDYCLMVVDCGQTRWMAQHPDHWWEVNPMMGKHPNTKTIDVNFLGAAMTYAVTAWALPPKAETGYKKWFNRENFFFTFTGGRGDERWKQLEDWSWNHVLNRKSVTTLWAIHYGLRPAADSVKPSKFNNCQGTGLALGMI